MRVVDASVVAMVVGTPLIVVTKSVVMVVTDLEKDVEKEVDEDEAVEVSLLDDDDSPVVVLSAVDGGADDVDVVEGTEVVVGVVVGVLLVLWLVVVGVEDVVWEEDADVERDDVDGEEDVVLDVVGSELEAVDDELELVWRFSTTIRACCTIGSAETTTASRTRSSRAAISTVGRLDIFSSHSALLEDTLSENMCAECRLSVCVSERTVSLAMAA